MPSKRIKKGDLVEFRIVSSFAKFETYHAPSKRYDWRCMGNTSPIILDCNKDYIGLVVDNYMVSLSSHVEEPYKPNAKIQPGNKQKLYQQITKYRAWHILLDETILYAQTLSHGPYIDSSGKYHFQWQMTKLEHDDS